MIIAVASGKGGTGKTTVAVNLAICLREPVTLMDCDVEEPNCHIFLNPEIQCRERVSLPFPIVDESLCDGCGECGRACQYNAIVALKTKSLVFPSLCHGCGACVNACPGEDIIVMQRTGVRVKGTETDLFKKIKAKLFEKRTSKVKEEITGQVNLKVMEKA